MGLRGHSPAKAVKGIYTDHLSHLAALYVTLKWLQTLPGPKIRLQSSHGWGCRVIHLPKLSRGYIRTI